MKRLLSILLVLCLIVGAMPLAYAEDSEGVDTGETIEADGGESPDPEESSTSEEGRIIVQSFEELQREIESAEDGATIYLQNTIYLDGSGEFFVGTDDKTIKLAISEDFSHLNMFEVGGEEIKVAFSNIVIEDIAISLCILEICNQNAEVTLSNVVVENSVCGEAIIDNYGNVCISNCKFENIQSDADIAIYTGSGIVYNRGTMTIDNSSFVRCRSRTYGIINNTSTIRITNSQIHNNIVHASGAVYSTQNTICQIENTHITNNVAELSQGAGIYTTFKCELSITDCEICGNSGLYEADDIYCCYGSILIQYTKPLEEVYTTENRVPYGWISDRSSDRESLAIPNKYDLPFQPDGFSEVWLKFIFTDEIPEPEEVYPAPIDPPSETEPQPEKPDDNQDQQPPAEQDNDQQESSQEQESDNTSKDTETPQEPPTSPSEDDGNSGNNYIPPIHWWPSVPDTPSTSPAPKEEDKEISDNDISLDNALVLICGNAVVDTSRSVVLAGYGDGLLHEEDPLTRAQAAQIIYRLLTAESVERLYSTENAFIDCPATAWYNEAVSTIANAGIVIGCGNGFYCPNDNLTWAQALTILTRFTAVQECNLQYIAYDGWALQAVETAAALGWIEDSVSLDVNAVITRGDFVELFNGVLGIY